MDGKYTCGVCGKTITGLDDYLSHVAECGKKLKAEAKAAEEKKYLEEVNAALNKVKSAKSYYEECLKNFKEKYPKEYELNFGSTAKKTVNTNTKTDVKQSSKDDDGDWIMLADEDAKKFLENLGLLFSLGN